MIRLAAFFSNASRTLTIPSASTSRIHNDKSVAGPGLGARRLVGRDDGHAEFEPLANRLPCRQIGLDPPQRRTVIFTGLRGRSDFCGLP
jgi:hypothetical protein